MADEEDRPVTFTISPHPGGRGSFLNISVEVPEGSTHVVHSMASVFVECLNMTIEKNAGYGDAWKEQGWMGNLARVMSKVARLKNILWRERKEGEMQSFDETVEDTATDLVNLAAFLAINLREGRKWGR